MNARGTSVLILMFLWAISGAGLPYSARAQNGAAQGPDAKPIGKVLNLSGTVTIEHTSAVVVQAGLPAGGKGQAKVDDPVYRGDLVETGSDGLLGISFADGTTFKLSNNARMELNEFVYDPKGNSNSTLFSLAAGSFTFLAGNVAKTGNMTIDTPVATMGIRGTAPRVEILKDGSVSFSTLIEENKKPGSKGLVGPRVRRTENLPSNKSVLQRTDTSVDTNKSADKDLMGKLKICRGC